MSMLKRSCMQRGRCVVVGGLGTNAWEKAFTSSARRREHTSDRDAEFDGR